MELMIGGAYAGKLTFAVKERGLSGDELFDLSQGTPVNEQPRCVYHLEALTKRLSREGMTAEAILEALLPRLAPDAVVVSREIGCGIVPTDAEERKYREVHGKLLRLIAERSDRVTRVFFGLEERLK